MSEKEEYLSYRQEMAIRDAVGNCRYHYCGKYRKRSDFKSQPAYIQINNDIFKGLIHVDPACKFCFEKYELLSYS